MGRSFVLLGYGVMAVTSDFGSESPGSSPGSPTKRDNLMKAIKYKCAMRRAGV